MKIPNLYKLCLIASVIAILNCPSIAGLRIKGIFKTAHGEAKFNIAREVVTAIQKSAEAKAFMIKQGICHPPIHKISEGNYVCSKGEPIKIEADANTIRELERILSLASEANKDNK